MSQLKNLDNIKFVNEGIHQGLLNKQLAEKREREKKEEERKKELDDHMKELDEEKRKRKEKANNESSDLSYLSNIKIV